MVALPGGVEEVSVVGEAGDEFTEGAETSGGHGLGAPVAIFEGKALLEVVEGKAPSKVTEDLKAAALEFFREEVAVIIAEVSVAAVDFAGWSAGNGDDDMAGVGSDGGEDKLVVFDVFQHLGEGDDIVDFFRFAVHEVEGEKTDAGNVSAGDGEGLFGDVGAFEFGGEGPGEFGDEAAVAAAEIEDGLMGNGGEELPDDAAAVAAGGSIDGGVVPVALPEGFVVDAFGHDADSGRGGLTPLAMM